MKRGANFWIWVLKALGDTYVSVPDSFHKDFIRLAKAAIKNNHKQSQTIRNTDNKQYGTVSLFCSNFIHAAVFPHHSSSCLLNTAVQKLQKKEKKKRKNNNMTVSATLLSPVVCICDIINWGKETDSRGFNTQPVDPLAHKPHQTLRSQWLHFRGKPHFNLGQSINSTAQKSWSVCRKQDITPRCT